jgi:nicotinate-nucleotide pyrophosphorylase (carboxylating)
MAVRIGGGDNHRFGLYDMVMIKDNHIDYAGGIEQAISKTKEYLKAKKLDIPIEVEARNLAEVETILAAEKVDRIMLDNFNYTDMKTAVNLIGDYAETEASGGITEDTIGEYAKCGVNYISVGALTHQIKSLDLSLKAID